MNTRLAILAGAMLLLAAMLHPSVIPISAAPPAQATEEPTKPPYVFPTPVFIPVFPDDTPTPRATPGRTVPIAGQTSYTIQAGDSPWTIAQKVYGDGTKFRLIMDANGITDQTKLRVGQVLVIPTLAGTAAPKLAPTALPPTPIIAPPTIVPTTVPTPITLPTPLPTPPATQAIVNALPTIVNVVSGTLFIASLGCAILAVLAFDRARRLNAIEERKKIRIR